MKNKMPVEFYLTVSALALGALCTIACFIGSGLLSPVLALSFSPALLAVCITALSFYDGKSKRNIFRASFVLFAIYFAFRLVTGNVLALLSIAAVTALFFLAGNDFRNEGASFTSAVACAAASVSCAVLTAANYAPLLSGNAQTPDEALGELFAAFFASKLSIAGYIAFDIVPIIFFAAVAVYIRKAQK